MTQPASVINQQERAVNIGTLGIGILDSQQAGYLRLRNIYAVSNRVLLSLDDTNIGIDVDSSEISLGYVYNTSTTPFSTSANNFVVIPDTVAMPPSGVYFISFSVVSEGIIKDVLYEFGIFVDGVEVPESDRQCFHDTQNISDATSHTQAIVPLDGTQTVDIRVNILTVGGVTFAARSIAYIRISP